MVGGKKLARIVAVFVLVVLVVSVSPILAFVEANGSGTGYGGGDGPDGSSSYTGYFTIENYIEIAAGYYLKAKRDVDGLLAMVELQDIEGVWPEDMREAAESASDNINNALWAYDLLIQKAEATPYNSAVISTLNGFDYDGFMLEQGVVGEVFSEVKGFLKEGDITGVFKRKHSDCLKIAALLNSVKSEIYENNLPGLPGLWKLNRTFARSSLFGSYVAMVFFEIR